MRGRGQVLTGPGPIAARSASSSVDAVVDRVSSHSVHPEGQRLAAPGEEHVRGVVPQQHRVRESARVRAHDRAQLLAREIEGEPLHHDAPVAQPVPTELVVLAGQECRVPYVLRIQLRVAADEVEPPLRREQELDAVGHVKFRSGIP